MPRQSKTAGFVPGGPGVLRLWSRWKMYPLAHHPHILGLRAFLTLGDLEFDDLALF